MPVLIDLDVRPPVRVRRPPLASPWKPLLAVALLLTLGGVAPPAAGALVEVAATGGRSVEARVLTADALFTTVSAPEGGGYGGPEIRAFPLRPGGPDWIVEDSTQGSRLSLDPTGSMLIVEPDTNGLFMVLDARTGRERWHTEPWMSTRVLGDRVALLADDDRLTVADLATGRPIWSATAVTSAMDGDAWHLVTIDRDGRATVRAVADGRVLAGPAGVGIDKRTWNGEYPEPLTTITVLDGRLYVLGTSYVAAYQPGDLTRLWRTKVSRLPASLRACGDAVCAQGPKGVTVLDAATGAVRWTDPRWRTVAPDWLVTGDARAAARVDPATGRVVRDLDGAVPAGDLALRTDRDHTWVLRLRDGRVVGRLPPFAPAGCVRHAPYLACPTDGRAVTVWRVDEP